MLKPPEDRLYLDDLAVGQRFLSGTLALDAGQIAAFAEEFDPQPFHLSDAGAAGTLFGSLAASGWHTAAITMRLFVDSVPIAGGVIGAGAEVEWPQPTRPGDVLQLFSEIVAIAPSRSRPDRAIVTMRSETLNQRGEIVQILTAKLVVTSRPPRRERLVG
jgi:acyl dehydratase